MDQSLVYILLIIVALIFLMALVNLTIRVQDIRKKLRYLNAEIARTTGEEQKMWKRRKRRFLLSLIFFFRR